MISWLPGAMAISPMDKLCASSKIEVQVSPQLSDLKIPPEAEPAKMNWG
jgi:hypothetical protein